MKTILRISLLIGFGFLAGCTEPPQTTMIGDYVISSEDSTPNVTSTLNVTSDTIVASSIASSGSLEMTASYKVIGVSSNTVTVELGQPNHPKKKIDIQVQNNSLVFSDNVVGGKTWKRK